jgi:hypothetical protein
MKTYRVTGPDGASYEIDGPEGATDEQVIAQVQAQLQRQSMAPPPPDPTADMSMGELALVGSGKTVSDVITGARQLYAGVADTVAPRQQISRVDQLRQEVADTRRLEAPLMNTTAGKVGNFIGNMALTAPLMAVPFANTVGGAALIGTGTGLLQPSTSTAETLTNTGLGAALGGAGQAAGQWLGDTLPGVIADRAARAAARQADNAVRDETLAMARGLGYKIPPATINQTSTTARAAESLAGKIAIKQTAAVANQRVTDRLVRQELGLAPTAELRKETLQSIRKQAGQVYGAIKNSGRITTDNQYLTELADLTRVADEIAKDFPGANVAQNEAIRKLQDSLLQQEFSANGAIENLKELRFQASNNLKWNVADPEQRALGMAQREAAGILEDQIMRHLHSRGLSQLANNFNEARQLIAKTYSVESAINDSTGHVVATKLSAQLKKGKMLSGNLEKIARIAGAVDTPLMSEQLSSPGVSKLVATLAAGAGGFGAANANPAMVLGAVGLPMAGEVARRSLLSKAGQNAFAPTYAPRNGLLQLLNNVSPITAPVAISVGNVK